VSAVPEPEPDSWLNPGVEVRPSDVAGHGLFAVTDLPAGTRVSRLGGRLVDTATMRDLAAASAEHLHTLAIDEDTHLLVAPGDGRSGNHHRSDRSRSEGWRRVPRGGRTPRWSYPSVTGWVLVPMGEPRTRGQHGVRHDTIEGSHAKE